jgi:hypothetical protein
MHWGRGKDRGGGEGIGSGREGKQVNKEMLKVVVQLRYTSTGELGMANKMKHRSREKSFNT